VPEAVAAARSFVIGALPLASSDLVEDAALVASEMVTNAVLHGDSAFRVHVSSDVLGVRIAVEDAVAGVVVPRIAEPDALNGRGLVIVDALSTRWGCEPRPGGKLVWAEIPAARELTA
jgi:anti-sigma regulatory factor (Ser/Thr protein kinase)